MHHNSSDETFGLADKVRRTAIHEELRKPGNHTCTTKILEVETAMGTGLASKKVPGMGISCNIHSSLQFNQFIIYLLINNI